MKARKKKKKDKFRENSLAEVKDCGKRQHDVRLSFNMNDSDLVIRPHRLKFLQNYFSNISDFLPTWGTCSSKTESFGLLPARKSLRIAERDDE